MRIALLFIAACGRIAFDPLDDAPAARCDPFAPFETITLVDSLNTPFLDGGVRLTSDELVAYWHSERGGLYEGWTAQRATRDQPFGMATKFVASTFMLWPTLTEDELTMVYTNNADLLLTTRATLTDVFPNGTGIAAVTTAVIESSPFLGPLGATLYFNRSPGVLLAAPWPVTGPGQTIAELDTTAAEVAPVLSADERVIYFSRFSVTADLDTWVAVRDNPASQFGTAQVVPELNTGGADNPTWLSPDLCRLYFESSRSAQFDLYLAERKP